MKAQLQAHLSNLNITDKISVEFIYTPPYSPNFNLAEYIAFPRQMKYTQTFYIKTSSLKNVPHQIEKRYIKAMDLELRPLNILIGANGAGKSNLKQVGEKIYNYVIANGAKRNESIARVSRFLHFVTQFGLFQPTYLMLILSLQDCHPN